MVPSLGGGGQSDLYCAGEGAQKQRVLGTCPGSFCLGPLHAGRLPFPWAQGRREEQGDGDWGVPKQGFGPSDGMSLGPSASGQVKEVL